jgi:hypothetical protein
VAADGAASPASGNGTFVPGRVGQAVQVAAGTPVAIQLPESVRDRGGLSFWFRPLDPAKAEYPILKLGQSELIYRKGTLLWKLPGETDPAKDASARALGAFREWEMVELDWGTEQPQVFFSGRQVAVYKKKSLTPLESRQLVLLEGCFDEVQAAADPGGVGSRFEGVVCAETFDDEKPLYYWSSGYSSGTKLARIPGALGSPGAIESPEGRGVSGIIGGFPRIVVTEDCYVCFLIRIPAGACEPNLMTPYNHYCRSPCKAGEWTPQRLSFFKFGLKPGDKVERIGVRGASNAIGALALDNFAVVRGRKDSRPSAPMNPTATAAAEGVRLSWQPATDEAGVFGYRIYRCNVPDFDPSGNRRVGECMALEFHDKMFAHTGEHWYRITALDCMGNEGPPSEPVKVVVVKK